MQTVIQICIWQSPFANGEEVDVVSLYANGDYHMHTGIPIYIQGYTPERGQSSYAYDDPHLHTG
jgi:hypothetical protein